MTQQPQFRMYSGDGTTIQERGLSLPPLDGTGQFDDPAGYVAEPGLRDAVNVALALGQPLLVTGEPGTGKTQLAASIAFELGLETPLVFRTKTTSTARDLFYRYDALRHFHDAQFREGDIAIESYIQYEALGIAILAAMSPEIADSLLPQERRGRGPQRSVVLIDEIDKAPRDVPNDVLNEIEFMSFAVAETGRTFAADLRFKPIVVLTSNSEKNLPDAFLRRCLFYHLSFPDRERLREIVQRRLGPQFRFSPDRVDEALAHFENIRDLALRKKPATAELLAWLRILERLDLDLEKKEPGAVEALALTYSILAKSPEDLRVMRSRLA